MEKKVIVSIKGGEVIDVVAPPDINVIIRDYDVDGVEESLLKADDEGDLHREMIW